MEDLFCFFRDFMSSISVFQHQLTFQHEPHRDQSKITQLHKKCSTLSHFNSLMHTNTCTYQGLRYINLQKFCIIKAYIMKFQIAEELRKSTGYIFSA